MNEEALVRDWNAAHIDTPDLKMHAVRTYMNVNIYECIYNICDICNVLYRICEIYARCWKTAVISYRQLKWSTSYRQPMGWLQLVRSNKL